jgi:hypothetical protein
MPPVPCRAAGARAAIAALALAAALPLPALADAALDAELDAVAALLPGRYIGSVPDPTAPAGSPPMRVYHRIAAVRLPRVGPGRAFYHRIARDGFDSPVPFQQKVYVLDEDPARPVNRMRAFVLAPGMPAVDPGPALAALDPAKTLRFPPECAIRWARGEPPDTWVGRVRRQDCSYRSERFGQTISPDLTYVVSPGWLAVEDLLYGEDGESLVPSPGLARAVRVVATSPSPAAGDAAATPPASSSAAAPGTGP